ncbi:phosphoethanolamine transferase [Akkermansia sp.]|uniref:phosphoethanolamine transferase n=1 Tax=Akkermansia sp. TaxID=1872421 RepID=UPI0025B8919C|nr:phosphoethanolamine transferase [Akkermansia sp.]MCC8147477.1 lipid A phosphoethanolamine transferase [Akkermansia sp.]
MTPPHASTGSVERYPDRHGFLSAICQALRAAFIPRRMRCLWAASLVAALVVNPYVLNDGQSVLMSCMGIVCSASLLCGTILLCLKYRFTAYVILPAVILFNAGLYMMQMRYGLTLNLSVLSSIAETNFREACAFCTASSVMGALLLAAFIYLAIYWSRRSLRQKATWSALACIWGLYGAFLLLSIPATSYSSEPLYLYYTSDKAKGWPFVDFMMTYKLTDDYITQDAGSFNELRSLPSCAEPLSWCDAPDDLAVVFHMGESVRADHLSLNGYHRNTMPLLSKESNVVSFPHATSFGIVTRISAIGMFTDAELSSRSPRHSSFIDLFNKHGFRTIRIMDLNGDSIHDYSMGILTRNCREQKQTPPLHQTPGMMQERTSLVMEEALKRHGRGKQVYVIYNNGSHMAFSYPAQAGHFTPASCNMDDPKARLEETVNAYDNSIVDLDASIHRMIAQLKDRPAIYFYCSDHGVALGEEGKMFQGHVLPPVYRPAMFVWYSDAFASRYPDMVRALKANRLKAVSHDHIFHTLLAMASIRSEVVRNGLNLASPDVRETPAPIQPEILAEWMAAPAQPQPLP